MLAILEVLEQFHNTLIASQHLQCHACVLIPLGDWPAFQDQPSCKGPLTQEEWSVEVRVRPVIVTHACVCLLGCIRRTVAQHSSCYLTSPSASVPSACAIIARDWLAFQD